MFLWLVAACGNDRIEPAIAPCGMVAPSAAEWTLGEATLTIGAAVSSEPYELSHVAGARLLSDDTVLILDGGSGEARLFDRNGRFLSSSGRSGRGPGEFSSMTLLPRAGSDSLAVFDRALHRVAVMRRDGGVSRYVAISTPPVGSGLTLARTPIGMIDEGVVVAITTPLTPREGGLYRPRIDLAVTGASGEVRNLGIEVPGDQVLFTVWDSNPIFSPLPFLQRTRFAIGDGIVYYVTGPQLDLVKIDVNSGLRSRCRVASITARIGRDYYENWVAGQLETVEPSYRPSTRHFYEEIYQDWPVPAVDTLFAGDAGRVWLKPFSADSIARWWVIAPDLTILATLRPPPNFRLLYVQYDTALGVAIDSLGTERLELRSIRAS